jgi:ribosomal protein S18 acetylase RimI-like enzyme
MRLELVAEVTAELVDAMARLLPQQSVGARHPTAAELAAVVGSSSNSLLIARDDNGDIVGTLTLTILYTPGSTFGFVEDVVVDESARGRGIGETMVKECLRIATTRGAHRVELHSSDRRQAAIRLYQRVGFKKFDTNVWRFVDPGAP